MNDSDKQRLLAIRRDRIAEYGLTEAGVDWSHKHSGRQYLHFEVLRQIEGFGPNDSVFDMGCGFGDLAAHLGKKGWQGRYLGLDLSPDTIAAGKQKNPGLDLRVGELLTTKCPDRFDWVFCSGALNYKFTSGDNYEYLERIVAAMFVIADKGVAFNMLSPLVDYEQEISFHPRLDRLLSIITGLTNRFTLRHDFLPFEFAVYMYKNNGIDRALRMFREENKSADNG